MTFSKKRQIKTFQALKFAKPAANKGLRIYLCA